LSLLEFIHTTFGLQIEIANTDLLVGQIHISGILLSCSGELFFPVKSPTTNLGCFIDLKPVVAQAHIYANFKFFSHLSENICFESIDVF